ncbi:MAG: FIST C-terminal domain-containing protein, partial [Acidobacteriota bacterium]
ELVRGLSSVIREEIPITGGLAGDADRFETTYVACNGAPESHLVAGIGFYGDAVDIGFGSFGGWDAFGPTRRITKAEDNVLYELDGKPALSLYKQYLGDQADHLPGSALLFPLSIYRDGEEDRQLVRTILSIDEDEQSMTFAGDIPVGHSAQLMMANFDRLVDGASEAARRITRSEQERTQLAVLISCVGRKIVLGQRTCDEVENVQEVLGEGTHQIGFYSYGEISPQRTMGHCELHNQTMTITLLSEA